MRTVSLLAFLGLASVAGSSAAMAADPISISTSGTANLGLHEQSGFDWSGFYGGVYGVAQTPMPQDGGYGLGVQAGVNAQFDFYLVGAEVAVQGMTGDAGQASYGQVLGRAGLVVTDDVLVYAAGGYGLELGAPAADDALFGGGLELAVSESVSLDAQYLRSMPAGGDPAGNQISLGANFHF